MDTVYEVLFVINDLLDIIIKCVALMAMHCYIIFTKIKGDDYR
tara:strand:- start:774 stop:902 length:129 start_codon:yes stop_codon:yes gene_type:complete